MGPDRELSLTIKLIHQLTIGARLVSGNVRENAQNIAAPSSGARGTEFRRLSLNVGNTEVMFLSFRKCQVIVKAKYKA